MRILCSGLVAAVFLLAGVAPLRAAKQYSKPSPKPLTPEQAADATLEAVSEGDSDALKSLAEKDEPDPWLVADELCFRGEHDAAEAFAAAAPRVDVEGLPAYVATWRRREPDEAERKLLAAMDAALQAHAPEKVVEGTASLRAAPDTVVRIRLHRVRGIALAETRRWDASHAVLREGADAACGLGWLREGSVLYELAARVAWSGSEFVAARTAWERRLELCERLEDGLGTAGTLRRIGVVHGTLGMYAEALSNLRRALAIHEARGDEFEAAATLGSIGNVHLEQGNYSQAARIYEQVVEALQALGEEAGVATMLGNLGGVYFRMGEYDKSLSFQRRALAAQEELGEEAGVALALGNIANVYDAQGEHTQALATYQQALAIQEARGDRGGAARTLGNMGIVHHALGNYARALSIHQQALAVQKALGDRPAVAKTLGHIGQDHLGLAEYAKALTAMEEAAAAKRALGDEAGGAITLLNLGLIHFRLGNLAKARSTYERALSAQEAAGDKFAAAATLGCLGTVYLAMGDHAQALSTHEKALAIKEALGYRVSVAATVEGIGNVYAAAGDYTTALSAYERALALEEALGDGAGAASTLGNIGCAYRALGDDARALSFHERALAAQEDLGNPTGTAWALGNIAGVHLARGDTARALSCAHRAVDLLGSVLAGLGVPEGASAREPYSAVYEAGARASIEEGNAAELTFFLESGRAGALLENLRAREALWSAALSPELRAAEARARAGEVAAGKALRRARATGDREGIRARRAQVEAAQQQVSDVIARIQREAKVGANVTCPRADSLEVLQEALLETEALLLLGPAKPDLVAVVVTPNAARVCRIGTLAAIEQACGAVRPLLMSESRRGPLAEEEADTPAADVEAGLARLRTLVVDSVELDEVTETLLVSPYGLLSYVPFALLFPEREVVHVPSGTTLRLLLEDREKKGSRVLALGAPDYGQPFDADSVAVVRGGRSLHPLPHTREEAERIGDEVLLGHRASKADLLDALEGQERWRAVHLACHGLLDAERPMFSSLALTPDEGGDGLLTCLDVFRLRIPSDLVVLSACETAKGRVYLTEGIVGLTRAFMFAGAPRVICSLWRVDDEATRALMVRFYELWNPKDGSEGLGAAAALKKAQEYVRDHPDHPEWEHPYYWAAWVLWGLAD